MHRFRSLYLLALATGLALSGAVACSEGPPADAVAVYDGGWVTAAEAQRFLSRFDSRRLRTDASIDGDAAATEILGELCFRKILAEQGTDAQPSQTPLYLNDQASLLVEYYIERKGKRSHEVTNDEALAFYREHLRDRFTAPERITFQHIFLRGDRHSPDELASLEREILDRLSAGVPFAELVAAYSESASADQQGVVGPVYRGRMNAEFESQLDRLEIGRSGAIHVRQGTHIVQVLERRPEEVQSFEEVRRQIVTAIMERRDEGEREQLLAGLRERYGVDDHSGDADLPGDETAIRIRDRSMTRQELDAYLAYRLSLPGAIGSDPVGARREATDELITANLLYLDAIDSGLDHEPEFLDRLALHELRRRSNLGARVLLRKWAASVGEDEVLAYYEENLARFAVPQRFEASYLAMPLGTAPPFEVLQRLEALARLAFEPGADPAELEQRCADAGAHLVPTSWMTPLQAAKIGPEFQRGLLAFTAPGTSEAFRDGGMLYVINVRAIEERRPMVTPDDMDLIRERYVQLRRGDILAELKQRTLEEHHFKVLTVDLFGADAAQGG